MKKIPTLFERDWDGDRSRVTQQVTPGCEWVLAGEGVPTRKLDGTACKINERGWLLKRRELRSGDDRPPDFIEEGHDEETGKAVGWLPVAEDNPADRYHREAFKSWISVFGEDRRGHTFELVGPKIQGNPEGFPEHTLIPHDSASLDLFAEYGDVPTAFDALRGWLADKDIEGIVWHHPDGRMAKIKKRDFGLKRKPV